MEDTTEAMHILAQILDYAPPQMDGLSVRKLAISAMDGDVDANALLAGYGLKVFPDKDSFFVANRHPRYAAMIDFVPDSLSFKLKNLKGVELHAKLSH